MKKAFVLHSGGLDSTALLYHVLAGGKYPAVTTVNIDYNQRHSKELDCAQKVLVHAKEKFVDIKLDARKATIPQLAKSNTALVKGDYKIPDVSYAELQGKSPAYVTNRNMMLIASMVCVAEEELSTNNNIKEADLFFGAHSDDAAGWAYPDCTPEFVGAMANAIFVSSQGQLRLVAPFQHFVKSDNVRVGHENGAPLSMTWSCYKGRQMHCGVCPTCRDRKEAFKLAKVYDSTEYAE